MTTNLENIFQPENKQEKTDLDVLKELFDISNIETKSELTIQQVIKINQLRMIGGLLGWNSLLASLDDFMLLMVSNKRQGRGEFISGFSAQRQHEIEQGSGGFFNKLKGSFSL